MNIIVHDTLSTFEPLFTSTDNPKVLLEKARPVLFDPDGLQVQLSKHFANKEQNGFYVMQAAQRDGVHVLAMQQGWGLFNPTRNRNVSAWQFEQFAQKDVAARIHEILTALCEQLPDSLLPPTLNCYLFPTDPANKPLMINNHGLSGFGFSPGHLFVQLWPSDGNLARLRPLLARLLIHTIRPLPLETTQTLADWLAIEGLAANFIMTTLPKPDRMSWYEWLKLGQKSWRDWLNPPADWPETLAQIAAIYGLSSFDDLVVNVYSSMQPIGSDRPPTVDPLSAEEREYARDVIRDGLGETDPNQIAAYLYGDEIVAEQGHQGVGLPPYAGFEVAHDMVERYLARQKLSLVDALGGKRADFAQVL